jgi:hypothetical protein
MTLQEKIDKYQTAVRNWTVENLKADKDFMRDCREDVEFRDYVLSIRPDMANEKQHRIKFLGLNHNKVPTEPETPQIEPEPVEKLSKQGKILKDLIGYKKKKGFL